VRQDLALVEGVLAPLGAAFPGLDPAAVLREFRDRVLDEFDLESEATAQRRFHRALRNHPFLGVPAPVMRLAHPGVLVSEWIDGVPLPVAADPDQACARLVAFVVGAARSGVVHADPDPRDVLVRPDGGLAILDFGATATVDAERVGLNAAGLEAFVAGDEAALGRALAALGWLPAERAGTALRLGRDVLGDFAGPDPVRLDSGAVIAVRDRADQHPAEFAELILAGALPPEALWPARGLAQLFATIARVGATAAWRELAREALRDGWDHAGSKTSP
jgi:predicted unusual protein kinase regulating ubiquinone biosynthesis (AarF/ABC1/UbiB family)